MEHEHKGSDDVADSVENKTLYCGREREVVLKQKRRTENATLRGGLGLPAPAFSLEIK